jgi:hypothetical protein
MPAASLIFPALAWAVLVGKPGFASESGSDPVGLVMLLDREPLTVDECFSASAGNCFQESLSQNILAISPWYKP